MKRLHSSDLFVVFIPVSALAIIQQFFERIEVGSDIEPSPDCDLRCTCATADGRVIYVLKRPQNNREAPKPRSLEEIIGVYGGGPHGRRRGENGHSQDKYQEFLSFIQ
jgi:hypothetical protein